MSRMSPTRDYRPINAHTGLLSVANVVAEQD